MATLAGMVLTARFLGARAFGEFGMIAGTVSTLAAFAGMGLGAACTNEVAQHIRTNRERTGQIIASCTLMGIGSGATIMAALWVSAGYLSAGPLAAPHLAEHLRIAALMLPMGSLQGAVVGALAGLQAYRIIGLVGAVHAVLGFPITIAFVVLLSLRGATLALVVNSGFLCVLSLFALSWAARHNEIPITASRWGRAEGNLLLRVGVPSMLSSAVVAPAFWLARLSLVNRPEGYAQLGVFQAADQWRLAFGLLPAVVGPVILPLLSQTDRDQRHQVEYVNILLTWFVVHLAVIPMMAFPEVTLSLIGPGYPRDAYSMVLPALLISASLVAYKDGIARKLLTEGLLWWAVASNLLFSIVLIGAAWNWARFGALGLSMAVLVAYSINAAASIPFYVWKDVAPRSLLLSWDVVQLWILLLPCGLAGYLDLSLGLRSALFAVTLTLSALAFKRIWETTYRDRSVS